MRKFFAMAALLVATLALLSGCANTGKQVKQTIDNVYYYALFGDEYTYW